MKKIADGNVEEWKKAFDINVFSAVGLVSCISIFISTFISYLHFIQFCSPASPHVFLSVHLPCLSHICWLSSRCNNHHMNLFYITFSLLNSEIISLSLHYVFSIPHTSSTQIELIPLSDSSLPPLPPRLPRPHNPHFLGRLHLRLPRLGRLRVRQSRPQPPRSHPQCRRTLGNHHFHPPRRRGY